MGVYCTHAFVRVNFVIFVLKTFRLGVIQTKMSIATS